MSDKLRIGLTPEAFLKLLDTPEGRLLREIIKLGNEFEDVAQAIALIRQYGDQRVTEARGFH